MTPKRCQVRTVRRRVCGRDLPCPIHSRPMLVLTDGEPGYGRCQHCGRKRELRMGWCLECTDPAAYRRFQKRLQDMAPRGKRGQFIRKRK